MSLLSLGTMEQSKSKAPVQWVRTLMAWLQTPLGATTAVALWAALTLIVGLGGPGLWEPQELMVADRAMAAIDRAPPLEQAKLQPSAATLPAAAAKAPSCDKTSPADGWARSLTPRATKWGIENVGMTDRGMRTPFAVLGVLCALFVCGIGIRLGSSRAGLIAGIIALSFPLLVLSAKQLTTEIATATGGSMLVYGCMALVHPAGPWRSLRGIVDRISAIAAMVLGAALAFAGGGVLLGVLIPVGACAAALGFGWPAARQLGFAIKRMKRQGSRDLGGDHHGNNAIHSPWLSAVFTMGTLVLVYVLAQQMYSIKEPVTGGREIFDKSIVPSGCYSWALGAVWPASDNLQTTFESSIEQIAYGTLPWGILAPIAVLVLLGSNLPQRRQLGALTLAWAAGAWIVTEAFQRKVGFTIYAGFPAMAVAIGVWLDAVVSARTQSSARDADQAIEPGSLLIGLFAAIGMIVIGKDIQQFPERMTSLLVGNDSIKYPVTTKFLGLPTRIWVFAIAALIAAHFTAAMWTHGSKFVSARWQRWPLYGAFATTLLTSLFWSFGWHPALSANLSTKQIFATFHSLRKPGDKLLLMGDMGNAPTYYADSTSEKITGYDKLFAALAAPTRVFAFVPAPELCALHREANGRPYFVLDDSNARSLLISNSVADARDLNPLATAVLRTEPTGITNRPSSKIVYDNRIEVIGWNIPNRVAQGSTFTVQMFYKVLQPIPGSYKVFMHFDGGGLRFNGDHDPIRGRCATSYWKPGDYIVDTFTVDAGGSTFRASTYDVWTGFFTGSSPNWRNMPVSAGPAAARDNADRVKLMQIQLQ
jgi:hypothetical protein